MYLLKSEVIAIVGEAIVKRSVLAVRYQHTSDDLIVSHKIAPFDIGSTNPKTMKRFAENLYAYSFTRIDRDRDVPDPKVVTFNIGRFLEMKPTGETFDENELNRKNHQVTHYDYQSCKFALIPNRDWFR